MRCSKGTAKGISKQEATHVEMIQPVQQVLPSFSIAASKGDFGVSLSRRCYAYGRSVKNSHFQ